MLFGGFTSNMVAGIISDKYEKKYIRTKPYICCLMSFMAIPTTIICFSVNNSFPVSMTFLFLEYLLAEGWNSPAISMIQQVVDPSVKGVAISIYLFSVTIAGTVASVTVGAVSTAMHTKSNPALLGYICAVSCAVPSFFAILCFYVSGRHFEDFIKCQTYCKKATLKAVGNDLRKFRDTQVVQRKGTMLYLKRIK